LTTKTFLCCAGLGGPSPRRPVYGPAFHRPLSRAGFLNIPDCLRRLGLAAGRH